MASTTTETMVKMVETLPPELHERVLKPMREFIEDILEEAKWNESFAKSQNGLAAAASHARKEIAKGNASPLDHDKLRIRQRFLPSGQGIASWIK